MEDWVRVLQNVVQRNALKLLLSGEGGPSMRPTLEAWMTKVKNGHSKRCWGVLMGKMFIYFKTPNEQVILVRGGPKSHTTFISPQINPLMEFSRQTTHALLTAEN